MGGIKHALRGSQRRPYPGRVIDGDAYVLWTLWSFRARVGNGETVRLSASAASVAVFLPV